MLKYNKETLALEEVSLVPFYFKAVVIILLSSLLCYSWGYKQSPIIREEGTVAIIRPNQTEFSEEALYDYLVELNVKFPDVVIAQARLETGNYTSSIFKENNNLFGMKEARVRISTNKGTSSGHAVFHNWQESVLDYAFYQARYLSDIKTRSEYFQYLNNRYAEDSNYINKVTKIAEDVRNRYNS